MLGGGEGGCAGSDCKRCACRLAYCAFATREALEVGGILHKIENTVKISVKCVVEEDRGWYDA